MEILSNFSHNKERHSEILICEILSRPPKLGVRSPPMLPTSGKKCVCAYSNVYAFVSKNNSFWSAFPFFYRKPLSKRSGVSLGWLQTTRRGTYISPCFVHEGGRCLRVDKDRQVFSVFMFPQRFKHPVTKLDWSRFVHPSRMYEQYLSPWWHLKETAAASDDRWASIGSPRQTHRCVTDGRGSRLCEHDIKSLARDFLSSRLA